MSEQRRWRIPAPGSRVRLRVGTDTVVGTVVESRTGDGQIPVIIVNYRLSPDADPQETEVPVNEVTLVESPH